MITRLTVSVEEAASMLGISRALAYTLVNRSELPSIRLGRRRVIPLAALERVLAAGQEDAIDLRETDESKS